MATKSKQAELAKAPLLMLMDGHAMVHRAWHAIQQPLTIQRTGEQIHGVLGFLNTFLRALDDLKPTHCAITFDLSKPTFRHQEYDEYKAQRPSSPPELRAQFPHVRRIMQAFEVPILEHEDYEADDVLGTLGRQAEEQGVDTIILTGDTDELQLVSPRVRVLMSFSVQGRTMYDVAKVRERYGGLEPEAVADVKALQGDTSDNIPGVPGIGSKTAVKLLSQYKSIEGIYGHLDEIGPPRIQRSLRENRETARRGKFLTTIARDVPVELDMDETRFWTYNRAKVVELLTDLEFYNVVPRVSDPTGDAATSTQGELLPAGNRLRTDYTIVDTEDLLSAMVDDLTASAVVAFDVEASSPRFMTADLVGLSFAGERGRGWYVPIGHDEGPQLPKDRVLDGLRPVLESTDVPKTAHSASLGMTVLANNGVGVANLSFDSMLAAHLCGRRAVGLNELALDLLHQELTPISEIIGTGRKQITMAQVPIAEAAAYSAANADAALRLHAVLDEVVKDKQTTRSLDEVETPLVPIIVKMQLNGVAIDSELLLDMSRELGAQLSGIESAMYETVGHEFNINSSQQLGGVLFDELRLPRTKKTKTGYSTDASSLEALKTHLDMGESDGVDPKSREVLESVLEYRQLSKIKSTYVDALPSLVNPATGRIHASYNQTGSATGRVSSNDPNVQNIPVRTELGRRVRKAFVAQNAPEWVLLGADYSQIELRILAHLSRDPGLLNAFTEGEDIHEATASSVYGVPSGEVDAEMRRVAKVMNFGVIYGLSPFGISQQTGFSAEEGKAFIDTYFAKYPGIKEYIDSTKTKVRKDGYVETRMGRRRYIPEAASRNFHVRGAGERMAINMPIQGTAADIVKLAMIRIQKRIDDLALRTMMIVQVHDELIFEVPRGELERMRDIVMELMPSAMKLAVPLEVELKTGANWGDME